MVEEKYVAFISYRHQAPDMEIAQKLHTAIETYRIPKNIRRETGRQKTGRVFRDQEELPLSADLGKDIETALDHSEWFIAVCSPRYPESRWCMRELEYFIEKKGRSHVLTILTEGEPENSFPDALLYQEDGTGNRQPAEPLAADVRGGTTAERLKRLRGEKLRLLAPILNVTYDDLRLRERRRRRKRIATAAAAVLAAAGVLTGIMLHNAALQREAKEQQRMAVSNSLGESMLEASTLRENHDIRQSAGILLDALALSEENDDLRRVEIVRELRGTMYISPFTVVSRLNLGNIQMSSVQISRDGGKLAGICNGNAIYMLNLITGDTTYAISDEIDEIDLSPDGSRVLAISGFFHYVTVWDTESGEKIFTYTSRTDAQKTVSNALFWRDSDTLLIQDGNQFYRVSIPEGTEELFYTMGDQQEGYDSSKALHAFRTGIAFQEISAVLTEYQDIYIGCPVMISPDGNTVLISGQAGETGTILLNDRGERIALLERMPGILTDRYDISPDGKYVSCQTMMGFAAIWDADTGKLRCVKSLDRDFSNGTTAPVFSPDSSKAAFVLENTLYVMDIPNGKDMKATEIEWQEDFPPGIHWSADGKTLVLFTPNLYMVNAETGSILLSCTAEAPERFTNAVPLGDLAVFVTRENGEALLYSLPGGSSVSYLSEYDGRPVPDPSYVSEECPWEEEPHGEHQMNDLNHILAGTQDIEPVTYFSADGEYAALLYDDGAIEIFRKEDSRYVYLLNKQFVEMPAAFGITGNALAAAQVSGGIMFQDLVDGRGSVIQHTDTVYTGFRFQGSFLMAIHSDKMTIDVFDTEKAEKLFSMQSGVPIRSFGFYENGNAAVAVTETDEYLVAELWQDENALIEQARILTGQ